MTARRTPMSDLFNPPPRQCRYSSADGGRMRVIGLVLGGLAMAVATGAAQESDLKMFAWLAGGWEMVQGPRVVEEHWTTPSANVMIGMSRTVTGDRTQEFEFLRIEKRGNDLFYVPQPNGRPPVAFKLTSSDGGRFVFENTSGEDRVSRIEYRRDGDAGLHAHVEGVQDGKTFALDFHYRRRK
jgi:hypothetical protein